MIKTPKQLEKEKEKEKFDNYVRKYALTESVIPCCGGITFVILTVSSIVYLFPTFPTLFFLILSIISFIAILVMLNEILAVTFGYIPIVARKMRISKFEIRKHYDDL